MLYSKIVGCGKPLIIVHGFLGMLDNWNSYATKIAAEGFEVHLLDMRNHGRSFHSPDFSIDIMAEDVLEYCSGNGLQKVFIIGHSMGGKVAMLFATKYADIVEKLIVVDVGTKYYPPHHQNIIDALKAVDFKNISTRKDVEEVLDIYIGEKNTVQFLLKNLYWREQGKLDFRFNVAVLAEKLEAIGEELAENSVFEKPSLFVCGEESKYILDEDKNGIKEHFLKAIFKRIDKAGHWVHADNPAAFYQTTKEYLD